MDIVIVKMESRKRLSLFLGMFLMVLLLGSGLVSASYYSNYRGNYGYENYYDSETYRVSDSKTPYKSVGVLDSYNYGHSYGNSYRNNYRPNLVSISSSYKDDDGWVYRSGSSSYRSYNSYYPGYSGEKYSDREYVINRYYPYYSYVSENSYRVSSGTSSYSEHSESNRRLLSRPEHYLVLWSYR